MTDVPDLVRIAFVAPIGNSDHSWLRRSQTCVLPGMFNSLNSYINSLKAGTHARTVVFTAVYAS